jgi:small-conductance mechanosensitive channel
MDLLESVYLGNTVRDWLIAAGIAAVVFVVLQVIQRVAVRKLSKVAAKTDNKIDDLVVSMIRQTKLIILLMTSIYIASFAVSLKPSVSAFLQKAIVLTLILQGGLWAGAGITFGMKQTISKRMEQDASSTTTLTLLGFVAQLILWVVVFLLILDNLGVNITGLLAGLGIGGIAVALAVQNILGDLLASLSIVLDKPFIIGDFIVVDKLSGTVEHIGLKTTRIRSLSGEQLIFSNNDLLKSRIHNYKRMDERRIIFKFGVVYQTPLEKLRLIKEMVTDIIEKQEGARPDRVHFKEYGDSSLVFEVVYFVANPDFNRYMDVQEKINLEIFRRIHEEGIEFAYPTQTIYVQNHSNGDR